MKKNLELGERKAKFILHIHRICTIHNNISFIHNYTLYAPTHKKNMKDNNLHTDQPIENSTTTLQHPPKSPKNMIGMEEHHQGNVFAVTAGHSLLDGGWTDVHTLEGKSGADFEGYCRVQRGDISLLCSCLFRKINEMGVSNFMVRMQ